ncbi:hypothetical protein FACS189468_7230 [Spirochaetia bacterium]|nr:hypothetical protein FACS189468_7230 [Spirochaetia bacterium]
MSDFFKGIITGAGIVLALVLILAGFRFFNERDRKIYELMEQQNEVQELREEYSRRDPYEFLEFPGVRDAADSNIGEFRERRDEILQRFRSNGPD